MSAGMALVFATGAQAGSQNVQLEHDTVPVLVVPPVETTFPFWDQFKISFGENAAEIFADRFHPLNTKNWNFDLATSNADRFSQLSTGAARGALAKSVTSGLREAALTLPSMIWLEDRHAFFANFFLNSLDSIEEESVSPLDPSYRDLERSWWKRLADSGTTYYGVRPFQTNPYAFVSRAFKDGDTLLVLAQVRYHYRDFADHRFEFALSVPLPYGYSIDLGTAYQFGRHDAEKKTGG